MHELTIPTLIYKSSIRHIANNICETGDKKIIAYIITLCYNNEHVRQGLPKIRVLSRTSGGIVARRTGRHATGYRDKLQNTLRYFCLFVARRNVAKPNTVRDHSPAPRSTNGGGSALFARRDG